MANANDPYTVLIIGNGFDLNQGFKTGYKDFMESDFFKSIVENNKLARFLKSKQDASLTDNHKSLRWIDIEKELKQYSLFSEHRQGMRDDLKNDFIELKQKLVTYIKSIDTTKINKEAKSFEIIQDMVDKSSAYLILDFNYTDTSEQILKLLVPPDEIKNRIIKVHGSVQNENIIFGVEDGADLVLRDHDFLRKSHHLYFPAVDVFNNLQLPSKIIIFGHTLGITDTFYFEAYFTSTSEQGTRKDIEVYYHSEKGMDELFSRLRELTGENLTGLRMNNNFKPIKVN